MERNNSEKLDSLISEVVKLSAVMSDISKEVHSVNNRMTGIEAVLNGINGSGGMVKDLANLGEKLSRLGGEHNNLDKQVFLHLHLLEISSSFSSYLWIRHFIYYWMYFYF